MSERLSFPELIQRVRRGEPAIRRAARFRLGEAGLRATLDSVDICQSVLASFFVRAATGQYEIDDPQQLLNLLVTMARNKVINHARHEQSAGRQHRQVSMAGASGEQLIARAPGPERALSAADLLQEVYRRLSPEERALVERRNAGRDWASIAQELGDNAVVLRKRLSRALNRITRQLGINDDNKA